jgi:DNA-directed RNA polymerase sigma subunit (sigma70/sigma32)
LDGPNCSRERKKETALAIKIRNGVEEAKLLMFRGNIGLALKIARDFIGLGVSLNDLLQESCIGLLKAISRYEDGKGTPPVAA